jgi:hypothetical protein
MDFELSMVYYRKINRITEMELTPLVIETLEHSIRVCVTPASPTRCRACYCISAMVAW